MPEPSKQDHLERTHRRLLATGLRRDSQHPGGPGSRRTCKGNCLAALDGDSYTLRTRLGASWLRETLSPSVWIDGILGCCTTKIGKASSAGVLDLAENRLSPNLDTHPSASEACSAVFCSA